MNRILAKINLLFFSLLLIEGGFTVYYILSQRIVGGHDGFVYFMAQYYFLNNAVIAGEIPQWLPFMTHGVTGTLVYVLQAGIFQNVLLLFASFLKNLNFLPLYHTGILIQKLFLLSGVWLLTGRFLKSSLSQTFVSICVLGSCIWMYETYTGLHLFYMLPLLLHLGHRFLETGRWRFFLLFGNLLALQMLGNTLYFFPMSTLLIFLYFFFYSLFNFSAVRQNIRHIPINKSALISVIIVGFTFLLLYQVITFGKDHLSLYVPARDASGAVSLETFLSFSVNRNMLKWTELLFGIPWHFDYTLYIGLLSLPLILFGLILNTHRGNIHFLCVTIILLLFSSGTFVSTFFYYTWPFMKFFRHLSFMDVLVKLFLCFLAGFGFEVITSKTYFEKLKKFKATYLLPIGSAALLLSLSVLLFNSAHNEGLMQEMITQLKRSLDTYTKVPFSPQTLSLWLKLNSLYALGAALLFGLLSTNRFHRYIPQLTVCIVIFHALNLYGYKEHMMQLETVSLNQKQLDLLQFQKIPYQEQRKQKLKENNPRATFLDVLSYKDYNNVVNNFLFQDQIHSLSRTNYWAVGLDHYMRAYWGQPWGDKTLRPKGLVKYRKLHFPLDHPAIGKISGLLTDKLQFFQKVYTIPDELIAQNIVHPDYAGDMLFISPDKNSAAMKHTAIPWSQETGLTRNNRLALSYNVIHFDSNHLKLKVNTQNNPNPWLFYSDTWHPQWQATVNGKAAPVFQANLAYKAIPLDPGDNTVHLYFKSGKIAFLQSLISWNALLWLGGLIWLTGRVLFNLKD